jgi:non-specific serine/threonine protein kinase
MKVTIARNRIQLSELSREHRKRARTIYGATPNKQGLSFPLEPLVLRYLKELFPLVEIGLVLEDVLYLTQEQVAKSVQVKKHLEDATILSLKKNQYRALRFFDHFKRIILADDRGLGKTRTALESMVHVNASKVLVVVPGYLKPNWYREMQKWIPERKFFIITGEKEQRQKQLHAAMQEKECFIVINYEMLQSRNDVRRFPILFSIKWDGVIFDEAHRLKNPQANLVDGAKKLKFAKCIMSTGTPISGSPEHIWQLLNILYPKRFTSYWAFVEYFCNVFESFFCKEIKGVNKAHLQELQWILQPIMIRSEKYGLPEKIRHTVYIELDKSHKVAYRRAKKFRIAKEDGFEEVIESKLERIIRFQQIVANPAILGGKDYSCIESTVIELIRDIGEKTIVGTVFIKAAHLLREKLKNAGFETFLVTGGTKDRDSVVEAFKKSKKGVLVGNIQAMAEGLSIDECDYIIFSDRTWMPHVNQQFEDRIHRMTSTRSKHYYDLLVPRTISELKYNALLEKEECMEDVLNDKKLVDYLNENL